MCNKCTHPKRIDSCHGERAEGLLVSEFCDPPKIDPLDDKETVSMVLYSDTCKRFVLSF